MPPMRVQCISRPITARKTCGNYSAGGTRDQRVRVISRPRRVRRIEDGLWLDRKQRQRRVHQPWPRRECVGELV
jgi:hypothetical protein